MTHYSDIKSFNDGSYGLVTKHCGFVDIYKSYNDSKGYYEYIVDNGDKLYIPCLSLDLAFAQAARL